MPLQLRIPAIPEISDERALELLKRIRPLLRKKGKLHEFVQPEHFTPNRTSLNWVKDGYGEAVDANTLTLVHAFPVYVRCSYHAVFRIQAGDVLAQIPEQLLDEVTAFEVLFGQELTEVVDKEGFYGHRTTALLYR